MALNPSIILSGQTPDVIGSLSRGMATGQQANQIQQQNALANLYQTQGAGIAAGDQGALNALAGFDPMAALGVQSNRLGMDSQRLQMDATRQSMGLQAEAAKRAAAEYASGISAEQAAQESAKLEQGVAMALATRSPEEFDALMTAQGLTQLVGKFAEREVLAAQFMSVKEVLDMRAAPQAQSPEGKFAADQRAGLIPQGVTQSAAGDNQTERDIALLGEIGIPRADAIRVTQLYTIARDPVTGEQVLIDKSTGAPVNQAQPAPAQTPTAPAAPPQPTTQPVGDGFGQSFPDSNSAFGVEGFLRGAVNTAADVVGAPVPYQETEQTQSDFAVLQERLLNDIASSYGRQPPSWLLQNIRALTPTAGSPFQGAGRAEEKLRALGRDLSNELANIEAQMQNRMAPADRQTLIERRAGLNSALSRIRAASSSFAPTVDIRPEVADRLRAYE
jgi:hypothetical protein